MNKNTKGLIAALLMLSANSVFADPVMVVDSTVDHPDVSSLSNITYSFKQMTLPPAKVKSLMAGKKFIIHKPKSVFENSCANVKRNLAVNYCKTPAGVDATYIEVQFNADGTSAVLNGHYYFYGAAGESSPMWLHQDYVFPINDYRRGYIGPSWMSTVPPAAFAADGFSPKVTFTNRVISFRDPLPVSPYITNNPFDGYSWHTKDLSAYFDNPAFYRSNVTLYCSSGAPSRVQTNTCNDSTATVSGEDIDVIDHSTIALKIYDVTEGLHVLYGRLE